MSAMQTWNPVPKDDPRPIVLILRGLLSAKRDSQLIHRARYKDLWTSVRDEFASETTFQANLNWLVKNRIVNKEKISRKEVWYSVSSGNSVVLTELSDILEATRKTPRTKDIHLTDLIEDFLWEFVFSLCVTISELWRPTDSVSRKLGPIIPLLFEENLDIKFESLIIQATRAKNRSALYNETSQGHDIVVRMTRAIHDQAETIRSSPQEQRRHT